MVVRNQGLPGERGPVKRERDKAGRGRFLLLLVSLVLLFVLYPVLRDAGGPNRYLLDAFLLVVILGSVRAAVDDRWQLIVAVLLVCAVVVARVSSHHDAGSTEVGISTLVSSMALFVYVEWILLRYVLGLGPVTSDKVQAATCAYLFLAIIWACLFSLLEVLNPGSFSYSGELPPGGSGQIFGLFQYYSLVTLSTLGYGDMTPATSLARSVASVEAVVGQLFLAVLIARLVGLHVAHSVQRTSAS